jgi:hypothetical protein
LSQATLGITSGASGESYESRQTYHYDRYGNRVVVDATAPPGLARPCRRPPGIDAR